MNGRKITRLLPFACVAFAFAAAQPLDAQFGGFGRKITEGVKKVAGGDAEEAKPGTNKLVVLPTNDPAVIPITDKVLEAFEKGVRTEIELRNQLRNEVIAREKAMQEYPACKQRAARSPEALQILLQLGDLGDNPSREQMTPAVEKMQADQAALVLKMCGPEPPFINVAERLTEIRTKAAAASGPIR